MQKLLSVIIFITLFSLLYVYQQTEIFRLAYIVEKKQAFLEDLLDKNTVLRYNINQTSSLVHIGDKISNSKDFQMPDAYRLVRMASPAGQAGSASAAPRETLITKIFSVKRQAEARTINP